MKICIMRLLMMFTIFSIIVGAIGCSDNIEESSTTFKMKSDWQINFTNNYYCGISAQPINNFVVEGLYNRLDTVDYIVPILADGMPIHNEDGTTTIKIKKDAKWQNGDDVISRDIWAFYMMQHTTLTYYVKNINPIDDKTLLIVWNENKPINKLIRDKLLALDMNCTIKYDEYKYYVDKNADLLALCEDASINEISGTPFGKLIDTDTQAKMLVNYTEFQNFNPSWFVATGPFKIKSCNPTQFILEKNNDYWAADQIKFDKIECFQYTDTNQIYNALVNNEIYYYDGIPEEITLNSILNRNKNLVNLKMLDITTVGINFNFEKDIWSDINVRIAFQYIFDREEIRNIANPYAVVDNSASCTMSLSERKKHLSTEHYDKIIQYTKNHSEAERLLALSGWTKKNGSWYDANNEEITIYMGGCSGHPVWAAAAQAAQAQLLDFGINCQLKLTDMGTLYGVGMGESSPYDCTVLWTELNGTLSHPYGSFENYTSYYGYFAHLERFASGDMIGNVKAIGGDINMNFPWIDGGTGLNGKESLNFSEYLHSLYYLDEVDVEMISASIVVGMSNFIYGVNFFQNVGGTTLNIQQVSGVALEEYWSKLSNVIYVPEITSSDAISAAQMNIIWSDATTMILGIIKPYETK